MGTRCIVLLYSICLNSACIRTTWSHLKLVKEKECEFCLSFSIFECISPTSILHFFDVLRLLSVLFCVSSLFCSADLILSYLAFVISASTQMTLTFRVTFSEKKKEKKKS